MLICNNCINHGAEKLNFENAAKTHKGSKLQAKNFLLILNRKADENLGMHSAGKQFSTENTLKPFSDRVKLGAKLTTIVNLPNMTSFGQGAEFATIGVMLESYY